MTVTVDNGVAFTVDAHIAPGMPLTHRVYADDPDPTAVVSLGGDDGPRITLDVDDPVALYRVAERLVAVADELRAAQR